MQLCELQRAEDFEVVFKDNVCGPFSMDLAAILEAESSDEQAEEERDPAPEEEAGDDARTVPDMRRPADKHGDNTESSGGGADAGKGGGDDDDDARATTSPVPSAGSDFDSAAYRDEDSESGAVPR